MRRPKIKAVREVNQPKAEQLGSQLKGLFDKRSARKGEEELSVFCDSVYLQHRANPAFLKIVLETAGEGSKQYFMQRARATVALAKNAAALEEAEQELKNEHSKIANHLQAVGVPLKKSIRERIGDDTEQDKKIAKCITKHKLTDKYEKDKYKNAQPGTRDYIKRDFWINFDFDKYSNIDEAVNERVAALQKLDNTMDYNKYKKALLAGNPSNMKEFLNLIEPGWSSKKSQQLQPADPALEAGRKHGSEKSSPAAGTDTKKKGWW